jgi:tetratricopeptide (TPR) repeat protein
LSLSDTRGVAIVAVEPSSAAERAGLRANDAILSVDGQRIVQVSDLPNIVGMKGAGTQVKLGVWREGRSLDVIATLADVPPVTTPQVAASPVAEAEQRSLLQTMVTGMRTNDEESLQSALQSIKKHPVPRKGDRKVARELNDAGLAALKVKDLSNAISSFQRGTEADPADQEIFNNLGFALLESERYKESETALYKALELNPERAAAWFNLGQVLAIKGDKNSAVACLLLSNRFSKNPEKNKEYMAEVLLKEKNPRAIEALSTAIERLK